MEKINLSASKRRVFGKKVKKLRKDGLLPANVYGKKVASKAVEVNIVDFEKAFAKAGESGLVSLEVEGKSLPVLIHNVQYHPVTSHPLHADFYQVDLKEKVTAKVPLELTGEAPAVKDKVGVLLTILSDVEVEALPADLPDKISVDVGKLVALDQSVKIEELKISPKIKIVTEGSLDIVKVAPLVSKEAESLAKEEAAAAAAAAAAATPATEEAPATGVKKEEVSSPAGKAPTPTPPPSGSEVKPK